MMPMPMPVPMPMPTVAQHAAERLVVDLHCEPTSLLTQPTACFHVATALAIMAAYVHALTLEEMPLPSPTITTNEYNIYTRLRSTISRSS